MRADKPRGPTLVSICMHALIVARASQIRDKNRRPCTDIPDQLQRRRGLRMLGQRMWPGLSPREGGLPKHGPGHLCVKSRGPTGDLLSIFYLGAHTSASGKAAPVP